MTNELLGKLNDAIDLCENNKTNETQITLSYAELQLIRRYELTNEYSINLAAENLRNAKRVFNWVMN